MPPLTQRSPLEMKTARYIYEPFPNEEITNIYEVETHLCG